MDINKEALILSSAIYPKVVDCINYLATNYSEKFYSFTFYCDSGCTGVGISASSYNSISNAHTEISDYILMNAAEWQFINIKSEIFEDIDEKIEELYEDFYDEDMDDDEIASFFIIVFNHVYKELEKAHAFSNACFEDDILKGLQFGDPSDIGLNMMDKLSSTINSEYWHLKTTENTKALRQRA